MNARCLFVAVLSLCIAVSGVYTAAGTAGGQSAGTDNSQVSATTQSIADEVEVRGLYSRGFEDSDLSPCTGASRWWVVGQERNLATRYRAAARRPYEQVFVRLRGTLSPPGQYGPYGRYQRQLRVTEVLDVRPRRGDPCR